MSHATFKTYSSQAPSPMLERTTPVPNWVLDQALSGLTDSQAKLLLIIARQTNGWTDGKGNRKSSDWMSSRFIQEKTGCSESSVSRAIAALMAKGLIEVRDSEGNLLLTAAERRRRKQMYFALKDQPPYSPYPEQSVTDAGVHNDKQNSRTDAGNEPLLQVQHLEELEKHPQHEEGDEEGDEQTNDEANAETVTNADVQSVEATSSVIHENKTVIADTKTRTDEGVSTRKSIKSASITPSNCGTTKETQTKENLINTFVDRQNDDPQNDGSLNLPHFEGLGEELIEETNKAGQPKLSNEAKQVLAAYRQQFREYFPDKVIPKATQSDFEKLESYFEKHTPQVLIKLLPTFFTVDYDFNSRNEHSLHAFVHSVNLLLYGMKRIGHFARIRSSDAGSKKAV